MHCKHCNKHCVTKCYPLQCYIWTFGQPFLLFSFFFLVVNRQRQTYMQCEWHLWWRKLKTTQMRSQETLHSEIWFREKLGSISNCFAYALSWKAKKTTNIHAVRLAFALGRRQDVKNMITRPFTTRKCTRFFETTIGRHFPFCLFFEGDAEGMRLGVDKRNDETTVEPAPRVAPPT